LSDLEKYELFLCLAQSFYYGPNGEQLVPDYVYDEIENRFLQLSGDLWVGNEYELERRFKIERRD